MSSDKVYTPGDSMLVVYVVNPGAMVGRSFSIYAGSVWSIHVLCERRGGGQLRLVPLLGQHIIREEL